MLQKIKEFFFGKELIQWKDKCFMLNTLDRNVLAQIITKNGGHVVVDEKKCRKYIMIIGFKRDYKSLAQTPQYQHAAAVWDMDYLDKHMQDADKKECLQLLQKENPDYSKQPDVNVYYSYCNGMRECMTAINTKKNTFDVWGKFSKYEALHKNTYRVPIIRNQPFLKVWIGKQPWKGDPKLFLGNRILFLVKQDLKKHQYTYMIVDEWVSTFTLSEPVLDFRSPVEVSINDQPNPYAYTEHDILLFGLNQYLKIPKTAFVGVGRKQLQSDPYEYIFRNNFFLKAEKTPSYLLKSKSVEIPKQVFQQIKRPLIGAS